MHHGWCTLVGRGWYFSISFLVHLNEFLLNSMLNGDTICKVTEVADKIGVGVHFNPFVSWNGKVNVLTLSTQWCVNINQVQFCNYDLFLLFLIFQQIYTDVQIWCCSNAWFTSRCIVLGEILFERPLTETSMFLSFYSSLFSI